MEDLVMLTLGILGFWVLGVAMTAPPYEYKTPPPKPKIQMEQQVSEKRTIQTYITKTKVISDPSGVRIEVNNDYICDTPCEISLETASDGRLLEDYYIKAYPTKPGQQVQLKFLDGSKIMSSTSRDKAPKRIFFDMSLVRTPRPEIDVNIR